MALLWAPPTPQAILAVETNRKLSHPDSNCNESRSVSFQLSETEFYEMQKLYDIKVKIPSLSLQAITSTLPTVMFTLNLEWCLYIL